MAQTIFDTLNKASPFLSVVGFLFVALIQFRYSRHLAKFASELQTIAKRQEITFDSLHKKRADVIAELYKQIVLTVEAIRKMEGNYIEDEEAQLIKRIQAFKADAEKKMSKLHTFIYINKIYFPAGLFTILELLGSIIDGKLNAGLMDKETLKSRKGNVEEWANLESMLKNALKNIEIFFVALLNGKEPVLEEEIEWLRYVENEIGSTKL
jgi:hypothetical protein